MHIVVYNEFANELWCQFHVRGRDCQQCVCAVILVQMCNIGAAIAFHTDCFQYDVCQPLLMSLLSNISMMPV